MIQITKSSTEAGVLPELHMAAAGAVAPGEVYVAKREDGALQAQLQDGHKVMLESSGNKKQKAELITCKTVGRTVGAEGTYLNALDFAKFTRRTDLTLRLYTRRDTARKIFSIAGLVLLLPTVGALITAVAAIFFVWSSQTRPTTVTVDGTAQTVLAWVNEPTIRFDVAHVKAARLARVHRRLDIRSLRAGWCLRAIEGQQTPAVTIPGVICKPTSAPWWQTTLAGSLITGGIAVLTAIVGIVALRSHYGFQQSPSS
jgi:hypothetical protein